MVWIHCLWVFCLDICKLALIWRTSLWDWELHHPEHESLELLEPDHPPFYFNLLILQDSPIGGCLLGLLKRANGDRKHSEVILACLSSKKEALKCDITKGTFHLGHRREALGALARHTEWGIFLNFMVDGKWQKWEWPSGAVSVKFRLQGAYSTADSAWVVQKQFRVHVWN